MNICTVVDQRYVPAVAAMLASVSRNAGESKPAVYVVGTDISRAAAARLEEFGKRHFDEFRFSRIDTAEIPELPLQRQMTRSVYLKLLLPRLLPDYVDRVIVLDADTLVQVNLDSLAHTRSETISF